MEEQRPGRVPIDRGWAWLVVLGAHVNMLVLMALIKSFGIIFVELLDIYGGTATNTAVVYALLAGFALLTAPITSTLADVFTCRAVCMCGSALFCLCLVVASIGGSLERVIYPYGIISGLGSGMILIPGPIIVARYFDKKRALANGVMYAGSGVGAVVGPYVVHYVLESYGLHQAFFMLGGLSLHTLIAGALFRPLSFYRRKAPEITVSPPVPVGKLSDIEEEPVELTPGFRPNMVVMKKDETDSLLKAVLKRASSLEQKDKKKDETLVKWREHSSSLQTSDLSLHFADATEQASLNTVYLSAINLAAVSIQDLPSELRHAGEEWDSTKIQSVQTHKFSFEQFLRNVWFVKGAEGDEVPIIDFGLLKNPVFVLYSFACLLGMSGTYVSLLTPAHTVKSLGFSKADAAILLSVMGVSDTVGRLFAGVISDRPYVKTHRVHSCCIYLLVASVSTVCSLFAKTFVAQIVYLLVCPFCMGAFIALGTVILVDLVGMHKLAGGWGLFLFMEGGGHMICPVLIGFLRDQFGSYLYGYVFVSACLLVASVLMVCIILLQRVLQHSALTES